MEPQLTPPSILLVEDVREEARALMDLLAWNGFPVRWAATVRSAWKAISQASLVVLDLGLPDGDGLDLLRRLRADPRPRLRRLPVLVLTGRHGLGPLLEAFRLGADDYLSKPYDPRELLARVRRLLGIARREAMAWSRLDAMGRWLRAFLPVLALGPERIRQPLRPVPVALLALHPSFPSRPDALGTRMAALVQVTRPERGIPWLATDGTLLAAMEDPMAALRAAIALARRLPRDSLLVHTGTAWIGAVGSPEWATFALIGPAVEETRRWARWAPPGHPTLTDPVRRALPPEDQRRLHPLPCPLPSLPPLWFF